MRDGLNLPWTSITRVTLVITALLVYIRLFIGVDLSDEAFYNAVPYSFVLGLRPYRDELNMVAQNAGILLIPFFKLHHSLVGSSFGLVLFNRHLYFILLSVCSCLSFRVGAAYLGANFGRLLAAFALTFSYFNIPSLSYNTFGTFFLFGGLFQLLIYSAPGDRIRPHWLIFGANISFVLSAFAYPTLLLSSISGFGVSFWLSRRKALENPRQTNNDRTAWYASLTLGAASAVGFFAFFGLDSIRDSLAYTIGSGTGHDLIPSAPRKAQFILMQLRHLRLYFAGFAVLLALPILPARSFCRYRGLFFCAVLTGSGVILFLIHRQPSLATYPAGSAPLLLCFGLLLPAALCFLPDRRKAREMALVICLPSYVAVIAASFSSTNGLPAATLGFFPCSVCCLLCVAMVAHSIDRVVESNGIRIATVMGALIPILIFQTYCLLERTYGDTPFSSSARTVFASGPFAGLLTTAASARGLQMMTADLNSINRAQTLFINGEMPGGYLLSPLRPRTFATWTLWPANEALRSKLFRRLFASAEAPPDAILQIGPIPAWMVDEVRRLKYAIHLERPELGYVLLLRERN